MSPEPTVCSNCGAERTGRFCANCGQRYEHAVHSVWHFVQEATEDLTHADSRVWRTLFALLFKPGFLTREFLDGRRARYLPPIRLYLVMSVLFFLVAGWGRPSTAVVAISEGEGTNPSVQVQSPTALRELDARPGETPQQREARVCTANYQGPLQSFVMSFIHKGCHNYLEDGGRTVSAEFLHNLPRAMFVFLPGLALAMKLLYWRPRRYYVEHLLFFLHNHAFAFLLFGAVGVLERLLPAGLGKALADLAWLYVPFYLFVSLRRVYGQSRARTFAKLLALSLAYITGAGITLALTSVYSVLSV